MGAGAERTDEAPRASLDGMPAGAELADDELELDGGAGVDGRRRWDRAEVEGELVAGHATR